MIVPKAESSLKDVEDKAEDNEGASLISPILIKTSVSELSSPSVAITVSV